MLDLSLSTEQEQLLHGQTIDLEQPGTILRNFENLLAFVEANDVKAAGKYNLLPIDAIPTLDERLVRPLRLKLSRPQLKSHPYLQALHLLLRASRLGRVRGSGDKARLGIDPDLIGRWGALNHTEKYFTLLEAAFCFGKAEMVGERESTWNSLLYDCAVSWKHIPQDGICFDQARPTEAYLDGIWRHFYLLALMDMFGLVEVEHASAPPQPWCPAGVKRRLFGDAIFTLLAKTELFGHDQSEDETGDEVAFGKWRPLLQPYFPDWRNTLELPPARARTGTFIFKVSLGDVWRRIASGEEATLHTLAAAIASSMAFDFDHLYEFVYRDRHGATIRAAHPACDNAVRADEMELGTLPLEAGQSLKFTYDFGDSWQFNVKLEQIDPASKGPKIPKIIGRHGKAPRQYANW